MVLPTFRFFEPQVKGSTVEPGAENFKTLSLMSILVAKVISNPSFPEHAKGRRETTFKTKHRKN